MTKVMHLNLIIVLISINILSPCHSQHPTFKAEIDSRYTGEEIISRNSNLVFAWKPDLTLIAGWPKGLKDADIPTEEASTGIYSRYGPDLMCGNGGTCFEYGRLHHLKLPLIKSFTALQDTATGEIVIKADVEPGCIYSLGINVIGPDGKILACTNESSLSIKTASLASGTYAASIEISPLFGKTILASFTFEVSAITAGIFSTSERVSDAAALIISGLTVLPRILCPYTANALIRANYTIDGDGPLRRTVTIRDPSGRTVKAIELDAPSKAGDCSNAWDGTTKDGHFDIDNDGYADEGIYMFDIKIDNYIDNATSEACALKIVNKPRLSVTAPSSAFSPNNDGINDILSLRYSLEISALVSGIPMVKVEVINEAGEPVKTKAMAAKNGENLFIWDGDDLPDGRYSMRMTAIDPLGNRTDPLSHDVIIDRSPPAVAVGRSSESFDPYTNALDISYSAADAISDRLSASVVISRNGMIIKTISSGDKLDRALTYTALWDGTDDNVCHLNEGKYELIVIATDEAMNTSASSCGILMTDDRRLTFGAKVIGGPYVNNWIEGNGNYRLLAQARSTSGNFVTFYLPRRQTIKAVTYNTSGASEKKRCALFDNSRKIVIFDNNKSGIQYYDLPAGSYTALADFTRWSNVPEAVVDIYAVDQNAVADNYSDRIDIRYPGREYLVHRNVDSSAFAGFMGSGNDEDYFTVNDYVVTAKVTTKSDNAITSQHQMIKFGKACEANSIYQSLHAAGSFYMTLKKGLYLTFVRASAGILAGWARTIVEFDEIRHDEYSICSPDSGRTWGTPSGPIQSEYGGYADNIIGYWGMPGSIVHKVEVLKGQLFYSRGTVSKAAYCSSPQFINNDYVPPSAFVDPEIKWQNAVQITFNAVDPRSPSLCESSDGGIHCAWLDSRDGTAEVYYQRIPADFEHFASSDTHIAPDSLIPTSQSVITTTKGPYNALSIKSSAFKLSGVLNYPNPFDRSTKIRYTLSVPADSVNILIYALNGRLAARLRGTVASGHNDIEWDGNDRSGRPNPNGAYVFEVVACRNGTEYRGRGKLVILR